MAKTTSENTNTDLSFDSMSGVLNLILTVFKIPREPISPLPPALIISGGKLRPGLSAISIAGEIIRRQSESGRELGDVFADGPNVEETMELIRIEEIIKALLNDAVVNVVIPPGISVMATGPGNLGMPVISMGRTTSMGIGNGIIR